MHSTHFTHRHNLDIHKVFLQTTCTYCLNQHFTQNTKPYLHYLPILSTHISYLPTLPTQLINLPTFATHLLYLPTFPTYLTYPIPKISHIKKIICKHSKSCILLAHLPTKNKKWVLSHTKFLSR